MASLEGIPLELLLGIASELDHFQDLLSLVKTSRLLYTSLHQALYERDARNDMHALEWAAMVGTTEVAQKSLNATACCKNEKLIKFLHGALLNSASNGHADITSLILSQDGVDPNFQDEVRETALGKSVANNHINVVKVLLCAKDINVNLKQCKTEFTRCRPTSMVVPLSFAAKNGNAALVRLLLDFPGINVNEEDTKHNPPILFAVYSKSLDTVKNFLTVKGLKINLNRVGFLAPHSFASPLCMASDYSDPDIAKLLLGCPSIDVDQRCARFRSSLHRAVIKGSEDTVKSLLACGANPNARDENDLTPLYFATEKGSARLVDLLLEAGADPNYRAPNWCQPFNIADKLGHHEVEKSLHHCDRFDLPLRNTPPNLRNLKFSSRSWLNCNSYKTPPGDKPRPEPYFHCYEGDDE